MSPVVVGFSWNTLEGQLCRWEQLAVVYMVYTQTNLELIWSDFAVRQKMLVSKLQQKIFKSELERRKLGKMVLEGKFEANGLLKTDYL